MFALFVTLVAAQPTCRFIRRPRAYYATRDSSVIVPTFTRSSTALPISASTAITSSAPLTSSLPSSSAAPTSTPSSSIRSSSAPVHVPSSSSSSSSSALGPSPSVIPGLLGSLFPAGPGSSSWSTSNVLGNALVLSDSTFRPHRVLRSTPHTYTSAPDGKRALQAFYPCGSLSFNFQPQGRFSFYAPGPASVDLTAAKEVTFSYSVYFPKGFNYVLGGKLPGLYGGNSDGEAVGCSGGSRSSACFSARIMWRSGGEGEFYTYLPPYTDGRFAANGMLCNEPGSYCHPTYGTSVGHGAFSFTTGSWTTVSERVRLNDAGKANGQLQLFVNGKSVINLGGLILRDSAAGRIRGLQMQTFFGGSKPEFATPKDQEVFFSDFSVAVTQYL
ncbi:hypothetical protein FA15DRAFT_595660 [Coprinopsis marcescibilis]|uniref:Polysaccharide lyase 14 domain-containing protein n=1 Tax=Coprinopsis marcescibilis TaxID=230819 RepID=A0A5C3KR13_COPMA|nr:hypothetical protein FA15DRAFT_595660 [Coprinopsis marcescibilis]